MEHLKWININFRYYYRKFGSNDKTVVLYNFLNSLYFYYLHAYFILMLFILDEMFNCHQDNAARGVFATPIRYLVFS